MSNLNMIIVQGNAGRDPELRHTTSGKAVCTFSLATRRHGGGTQWFNVKVWEKQAELTEQYVKKGSSVTVVGRMESRDHAGKTYWDLVATKVSFGDRRDTRDPRTSNELYKENLLSKDDVAAIPMEEGADPVKPVRHLKQRWDDSEIPF